MLMKAYYRRLFKRVRPVPQDVSPVDGIQNQDLLVSVTTTKKRGWNTFFRKLVGLKTLTLIQKLEKRKLKNNKLIKRSAPVEQHDKEEIEVEEKVVEKESSVAIVIGARYLLKSMHFAKTPKVFEVSLDPRDSVRGSQTIYSERIGVVKPDLESQPIQSYVSFTTY